MVIVRNCVYEDRDARNVIRRLGLSEEAMQAAEAANPDLEWLRIVLALDRVFLAHGGAMAQVNFLRSPSPSLGDRAPVDVLVEQNGAEQVCRAAHAFAAPTVGSGVMSSSGASHQLTSLQTRIGSCLDPCRARLPGD